MAEGDIGSVVDSLEFDGVMGGRPDIIHVAGDVYAIVYQGPDTDGWLKTVTINAAGEVALVSGGSLEFDTVNGQYPRIIHINGEVFAIAYQGVDVDGWLKTVTISADGATISLTGYSVEWETVICAMTDIIHVVDDVYAIAYQGPDADGWLKTVSISDAGVVALVSGGSLEFDTVDCQYPSIVHVNGDVYAIAYQGTGADGWLKTVTISASGSSITLTGYSLEFDTDRGVMPKIIHVSGEVYAIAYQGTGVDGWLKTVTISDAGEVALVSGGSLEFEAVNCYGPDIAHVSGDIYAIAYQGDGSDGWVKTVSISADGATLSLTGQSLEFDTGYAYAPEIFFTAGNMYVITYTGVDEDGWLKTVDIETVPPSVSQHLMMVGLG